MRVAIIGCGYVGLVTGVCLAELGLEVRCVDIDGRKVEHINSGRAPFYEPRLNEALTAQLGAARLRASDDVAAAVAEADAVFIAVGTPSYPDGSADLSHVEAAARQVAQAMRPGCVVVSKSTVPVGTARRLRRIIEKERPGVSFSIASNPEFLREGSAIDDFMNPDRVVIGCEDDNARQILRALYAPFAARGTPIVETTLEAAEMIKYVANAFLATKVAFINEVADLCETVGADVDAVAAAVGLDRRIGTQAIQAGPGFGGSCFPKDIRAFAELASRQGVRQPILEQVEKSNETRKLAIAQRILRLLGGEPAGKTVAILGLAFKAGTDDIREAPSLTVIPSLQAAGVHVRVHDYAAMHNARAYLSAIAFCETPYVAAEDTDLLVVLTEWPDYRNLDLERVALAMKTPRIFDTRRVISEAEAARHGIELVAIGRKAKAAPAKRRTDAVAPAPAPKAPRHVQLASDETRRIMVAGGAGFIGSHLCERLLREGHHVLAVDNLSTGLIRNVARLQQFRRFTFLRQDIIQPIGAEVDQIYNLACPASPPRYQADPVQTAKTSVIGSVQLLELAERLGAKILQASTSEVYGDPEVHPQPESYWGHVNPIGVRACYDEGKRCAETLFFDYGRHRDVRVKVARIFNTYGPQMDPADGRVVSNFIVQALTGASLTIYGDGMQTRSFCYVDDLVDGLIRLMNSPDEVTGPINFGNPSEFTMIELAILVRELTASTGPLDFLPLPQDDPKQRKPDITLAETQLGWTPKVRLRDGLALTIPYFAEVLGLPLAEGQNGEWPLLAVAKQASHHQARARSNV